MADIFFGKFSEIVSPKNLDNKNDTSVDNEKKVTIDEKTKKNNFRKKIFYIVTIFLILSALYIVIK